MAQQPVPTFTAETTCRPAQALDPACASHVTNDTMAAELDALMASAPPAAGWAPLHAPYGAVLGFHDTAAEASALQSTVPDGAASHRPTPALLALGGLLVLLRKRPT